MNSSIASSSQLNFFSQVKTTNLQAVRDLLPLSGFETVTSVMCIVQEALFSFSADPDTVIYFNSANCTGLTFTGTVHKKVMNQWINMGTHTFDQKGLSKTITLKWDEILIIG